MRSQSYLSGLLVAILGASPALARTDLSGCVSTEVIIQTWYASYIWYVPDTGEICDIPDCGGGRAPPKTVPGCPGYHGTETLTPSFLPGFGDSTATATGTGASGGGASSATATATSSPGPGSSSSSGASSTSGKPSSPTGTSATITSPAVTSLVTSTVSKPSGGSGAGSSESSSPSTSVSSAPGAAVTGSAGYGLMGLVAGAIGGGLAVL